MHRLRCRHRIFRTTARDLRLRAVDPSRLIPRLAANETGKYCRTLPIHENMQSSIANVGFLFGSDNFSFRGIFLTGNPFAAIVFGFPNRRPSFFRHGAPGLSSNDSPAASLIDNHMFPHTEPPIEVRDDRLPRTDIDCYRLAFETVCLRQDGRIKPLSRSTTADNSGRN